MMQSHIFDVVSVQRGAVRPRAARLWHFRIHQWQLIGILMIASSLGAERTAAQEYRAYNFTTHQNRHSVQGPDENLLRWVNRRQHVLFSGWMQTADATFYPVAYTSVPLYWGVSLMSDEVATQDALTFTAGWIATAGSTMLLKRLVGRERPYVSRNDLIINYSDTELRASGNASSFPSGHTSMSVFLATYLALESNTPFVRITGGVWASSVAVSRVWNGVHFPTDIFMGAILGSGVAMLSHHLR